MNILILGGTSEASELVALLAGKPHIQIILSLAGRTKNPVLPQVNCRVGGFGGAYGLADYIKEQNIGALVCATHPFAQKMPFNAQEAAKIAGVPLLYLLRPQWEKTAQDMWIEVASHRQASKALGIAPKRIFLSVGKLELEEYINSSQHYYVIRSIDEITGKPLKNAFYITSRPPFNLDNEYKLLHDHKIDYLVSKNSGGAATSAKLAACSKLKIPVIMISRPRRPAGLHVQSAQEAMDWVYKNVV